MIQKKYSKKEAVHRSVLIGSSASILMALFSPSTVAAEVNAALNPAIDEDVEVIEVTGVRASLESALMEKREASSIVDAISAKDMDSLPALNLGEAMQALPGVQLNTDDGSRNAEITLRGLPGGYAKTLTEGQSFATPSRSMGVVGSSNPFGAFEGGVFDGVTVVKAPTADLQEGGMAGVVNQKLQRALGQKDGKYSLGVGARYEELSANWDKQIRFSASKHLIKDELAVAFKIAGSDQNFRRDTVNFSQYTAVNNVNNNAIDYTGFISKDALNEYKSAHGINDPLSIIKVIGKAAQVTENSRGNRVSATGNIEWKPVDSLKLGVNLLYTRRDLGESNMEDVQFSINTNDDNGKMDTQTVELLGAPIRLSDNANPAYKEGVHSPDLATIPVYAVTHANLSNVSWSPSNRLTSTLEEAKGVFLYANYNTDDWVIDATVSKSNATNEYAQSGLDIRHQNKTNKTYKDLDDGKTYYYGATGINGEINTGEGDLSKAFASITGFDNRDEQHNYYYSDAQREAAGLAPIFKNSDYDLEEGSWQRFDNGWKSVRLTAFGSTLDPKINPYDVADYEKVGGQAYIDEKLADEKLIGGKSVDFYVNGREQRPERDMEAFEFNAERYVDLGGDFFRLTSVKSGFRHSRETLETYDVRVGGSASNLSTITGDEFYLPGLTSDEQTEYFNGDYQGHYGSNAGWKVINAEGLKSIVQTGYGYDDVNNTYLYDENGNVVQQAEMVAFDDEGNRVNGFAMTDSTGFPVKLQGSKSSDEYGLNENYRFNFDADQAINAIYLMGKFEGEIGDITYTGNVGVRYVETTNDVLGQGFNADGKDVAILIENDYDNTLPSLNLAIDLADDVVLRTAYSKALVRPNLMSQTPSPTNTNSSTRVKLENAKAEVLPYTADNYDMSLAWYNRDGSSISAGFFYKEIEGKIVTETICPTHLSEEAVYNRYGTGPLELLDDGTALGECRESSIPSLGEAEYENTREVVIKETFNSDIPVKVYGYELAVQQKLDFLPYPWNGFGGVINFTKIDLDEGGGTPMTRIAPYTTNVIGYYENDGFSLRLAYNWQDEKLLSAGGNTSFLGSDARTQTAGGRLDLSTSYRVTKGLKVSVKAYNLNNRQEYEYIGGNDKAINRIRYAGRTIAVNASYSF